MLYVCISLKNAVLINLLCNILNKYLICTFYIALFVVANKDEQQFS